MKTPEQIADDVSPEFEAMGLNESFRKTMRTWIIAAVEADRAQRPEAPAYKVGDPDPTPDFLSTGENYCDVGIKEGFQFWACTWEPNHPGRPHVAGDGEIICAVWS